MKQISPAARISSVVLAFALLFGFSAVGSVALADEGTEPVVYVDGVNGNDANDGISASSPVKTLEKATLLATKDATIMVSNTIDYVNANEPLNLKSWKLERSHTNNFPMIRINASAMNIVGEGAVIDGKNVAVDSPLIAIDGSNVTLEGVTLTGGHNSNDSLAQELPTDNWAGQGGAIGVRNGSTLTLADAQLKGNQATLGGAVFVDASTVNVNSGTLFDGNEAKYDKGQNHSQLSYASGGAIFVTGYHGKAVVNVNDGSFVNNVAPVGGAIATGRAHSGDNGTNYRSEYYLNMNSQAVVNVAGGTFDSNHADIAAGALYVQANTTANVSRGRFLKNTSKATDAPYSGGAIYIQGQYWLTSAPGTLNLTNALIRNNSAGRAGGGILLCPTGEGKINADQGAAVYDNTSPNGGDVYVTTPGHNQIVSLSNFALNSVQNNWEGNQDPYAIVGEKGSAYFKNVLSDDAKAAASANALVVFEHNSTPGTGGAISNNGVLNVGLDAAAFYLQKVDSRDGTGLNGAEFRLKGEGYDYTVTSTSIRGNQGVAAFRDLRAGTYTLTEVKAPESYPELRLNWTVVVAADSEKGYTVTVTDMDGNVVKPSGQWNDASTNHEQHGSVYDMFKLENDKFGHPDIATTARDSETGTNIAKADDSVIIIDTVSYENVIKGTYILEGTLMNKATGEPVTDAEGNPVTARSEAQELEGSGSVEITFPAIDASALAGNAVVVFEKLIVVDGDSEREIVSHDDLDDEAQTVSFPEVTTTATDKEDGDKVLAPEKVTVVDTVNYTNLVPGKEYTVSGVLMDKATGEALVVKGKKVTAEKTFTAETADGAIELEFTFDASALEDKTLVVFETVTYEGVEVAVHADINDEAQTVTVTKKPVIATTATGADGESKDIDSAADQKVVDTVTYSNLVPGKTYTLKGTLVKKSDESVVAEAEATFVPEEANGETTLTFTLDASELGGESVVAHEYLFRGDVTGKDVSEQSDEYVTKHEDINDENQTVYVKPKPEVKDEEKVVELGTTATDNADGDKELAVGSDVTVKDVVKYTNLMPNQTYTLKGQLVVKGTNGKDVVATADMTFVADATGSGAVDMLFNLNTVGLDGKELVAYEYLFLGDVVGEDIDLGTVTKDSDVRFQAKHADDNDQAQTVTVAKKPEETVPPVATPTPEKTVTPTVPEQPTVKLPVTGLPKTGSPIAVGAIAAFMFIAAGLLLVRYRND